MSDKTKHKPTKAHQHQSTSPPKHINTKATKAHQRTQNQNINHVFRCTNQTNSFHTR